MIILNETLITTEEALEAAIAELPEATQNSLRASFAGESTWVELTTEEKDRIKYLKRGEVLNKIISEVATENIARVRTGTWTVEQLIALTQDAGVKEVLTDLVGLSFEIAHGKIDALTPVILTTEIKTAFKAKLASHFYNWS